MDHLCRPHFGLCRTGKETIISRTGRMQEWSMDRSREADAIVHFEWSEIYGWIREIHYHRFQYNPTNCDLRGRPCRSFYTNVQAPSLPQDKRRKKRHNVFHQTDPYASRCSPFCGPSPGNTCRCPSASKTRVSGDAAALPRPHNAKLFATGRNGKQEERQKQRQVDLKKQKMLGAELSRTLLTAVTT